MKEVFKIKDLTFYDEDHAKDYDDEYKYRVIAIYKNEIWVENINLVFNNTALYRKDTFEKDNTKL